MIGIDHRDFAKSVKSLILHFIRAGKGGERFETADAGYLTRVLYVQDAIISNDCGLSGVLRALKREM